MYHTRDISYLADILRRIEFDLEFFGYSVLDTRWHSEDCSVPFNRLYLTESGGAMLQDEHGAYPMEPGVAYLIPAGHRCSYYCPDAMQKFYFHFNFYRPDRYDLLWDVCHIAVLPMEPGDLALLQGCMGEERVIYALQVQNLLLRYVLRCLQAESAEPPMLHLFSPPVSRTIDTIRQNLSARLTIDELARQQFLSRTRLSELFRRETGVTLGRYMEDQLMLEAQKLLYLTDDSIAHISQQLGFCDQFYFSRRFKLRHGITPLQYRKKQRHTTG